MGTIRILVIDDEQVICDGCKMVLTDKAYSVDSRLTGAMGLHALQENTYDLLLLDRIRLSGQALLGR
jgi:DNA-binding response OmpR family regulator